MTVRDIAKIANVSPAAVSIVLNNKPGVSEKTRKHIMAVIEEYGYEPHKRKIGKKGNIHFVKYTKTSFLTDKNDNFFSEILESIASESRKAGFNLIISTANDKNLMDVLENIKSQPSQGLLFLGTEYSAHNAHLLSDLGLPLVVIDNSMPFFEGNCVVINNKEMVGNAVHYLYNLGHREIGYIRSKIQISNFEERAAGFKEGIDQLNLEQNPDHEFVVLPNIKNAYEALLDQFASVESMPTAFFCDNDTIAIGATRALKALGYKIPEDLSVMGFDDIPASSLLDTPLSTMKVYCLDIGKWAVRLLQNAMYDVNPTSAKILTSGKLKARSSTGPAQVKVKDRQFSNPTMKVNKQTRKQKT